MNLTDDQILIIIVVVVVLFLLFRKEGFLNYDPAPFVTKDSIPPKSFIWVFATK